MKTLPLVLILSLLCSCATTMPGADLQLNSTLLSATVSANSNFSNDTIKMYQVSIKNLSNTWIDVDSVTLDDPTASVEILVGPKLNAWIEANQLEKSVSDYNTSLILGSIAAAGLVVGGTSNNNTTSAVGLSFAVGALTVAGVNDFVDSKNKVEFQKSLPESHLLRPFMIPSTKVMQRWIVIENPKNVGLKFTLNSKVKEVGPVKFEIAPERAAY